jgi:YnbE-like lipoprotein
MKYFIMLTGLLASLSACTPTVKLEAPDKPIEINMNIKIEQEVRVRIERDLDKEILANPDLFGTPNKEKK